MRGIAGGLGVSCLFTGLKLLPLSEAVVLTKSTPLWTALIVVFVLKQEQFSVKQFFIVLLCLFGISLIARPPFIVDALRYIGLNTPIES